MIENRQVDLIVNIPRKEVQQEVTTGYQIRRKAMDYGVQLITNLTEAITIVRGMTELNAMKDPSNFYGIKSIEEIQLKY